MSTNQTAIAYLMSRAGEFHHLLEHMEENAKPLEFIDRQGVVIELDYCRIEENHDDAGEDGVLYVLHWEQGDDKQKMEKVFNDFAALAAHILRVWW